MYVYKLNSSPDGSRVEAPFSLWVWVKIGSASG